ncbi:hypothetical protein SAICODRAFT_6278 [Saitoella complicata NRRL Y-17804]|uniref:UDENN domain-containing protein n=1 Tax=Saitoella complicata (strain BCRC 22490 / CBS 7301 / JCM 7358 / NBRC 10748 / NRRL Y-17804) TaxID=698492 RepID=A0A0E9NL01_SAICN|nr:uncharacterized protein SAICODRAFT_6278 [Saitoella complicata NRRL Y-17804]ODQ54542.1 hypothetical protein SAICODRAFT_6278 [Saitoella complicata NRRL Y-17804]GAO50090.1 hypothetical protein G7K_4225-t1 [Saitoella complicata NRRL Y-17804]
MLPIAALFVATFDVRQGYSIVWQKHNSDLDLSGVEFSALPSGLHAVDDDLIHFTHQDGYVGISAFASIATDSAEERGSRSASVGLLVRESQEAIGTLHEHSRALKHLARKHLSDPSAASTELETYYTEHAKRKDTSILEQASRPTPDNYPSEALRDLQLTFGPLLFRLYRAALTQRRILLSGDPPVRRMCDMVYNIQHLASIPRKVGSQLDIAVDQSKLLFCVGVSDIPRLEAHPSRLGSEDRERGWLACTTDRIISSKPQLYDIHVNVPKHDAEIVKALDLSNGQTLKPSLRDVRVYQLMLRHMRFDPLFDRRETSIFAAWWSWVLNWWQVILYTTSSGKWGKLEQPDSAGSGKRWDAFDDMVPLTSTISPSPSFFSETSGDTTRSVQPGTQGTEEHGLKGYFERVTKRVFSNLALILEAGEEDMTGAVTITYDDMRNRFGLVPGCKEDREFLSRLAEIYFGKRISFERKCWDFFVWV